MSLPPLTALAPARFERADLLGVSRLTAPRYLGKLAADGFLTKLRIGRANYYIHPARRRISARDPRRRRGGSRDSGLRARACRHRRRQAPAQDQLKGAEA